MMLGSVNAAAGQFTLDDGIDAWSDLFRGMDRELEYVSVEMATSTYQANGGVRRDDRRVVADLRRMGLRALRPAQDQDPDPMLASFVRAECAVNEFVDSNETTVSLATSIYIEIWDHIRSTKIPVYRALQIGTVGSRAYRVQSQVEICADYLSDPLIRMGFER